MGCFNLRLAYRNLTLPQPLDGLPFFQCHFLWQRWIFRGYSYQSIIKFTAYLVGMMNSIQNNIYHHISFLKSSLSSYLSNILGLYIVYSIVSNYIPMTVGQILIMACFMPPSYIHYILSSKYIPSALDLFFLAE